MQIKLKDFDERRGETSATIPVQRRYARVIEDVRVPRARDVLVDPSHVPIEGGCVHVHRDNDQKGEYWWILSRRGFAAGRRSVRTLRPLSLKGFRRI